jgi:hypothetical protein
MFEDSSGTLLNSLNIAQITGFGAINSVKTHLTGSYEDAGTTYLFTLLLNHDNSNLVSRNV